MRERLDFCLLRLSMIIDQSVRRVIVINNPEVGCGRAAASDWADRVFSLWYVMVACRGLDAAALSEPLVSADRRRTYLPLGMHAELGELYVERAVTLGLQAGLTTWDDFAQDAFVRDSKAR
jgi:hypothetical protein